MQRKKIIFLFSLFIFAQQLFAQHTNYPLSKSFMQMQYNNFILDNTHTAFKPIISSFLIKKPTEDHTIDIDLLEKWYLRKLFNEHFFVVENEEYNFIVSPIVNFAIGREFQEDKSTFTNTRGFLVQGDIGKRLSFESSFLENQSSFPNYLNDFINQNNVVPGQGFKRDFKDGFDYAMASGYVSLRLSKFFYLQFGHGKHFIGEGYRSLLLSDASFNYPYLRLQTNIGSVQYVNLYAEFQDIKSQLEGSWYETGFAKKYMSSHHLSININDKLNLGIYEAIIWKTNHAPGNSGFDINYLNPTVFLRPIEYSMNSPDNVLAGFLGKYQFTANSSFYAQLILDEFSLNEIRKNENWWGNKYGYQLGFKSNNIFKIQGLSLCLEHNLVRPYTYAHSNPLQNYAHYNQPLAHPLGANFSENLAILNYQQNRFFLRFQATTAKFGGKIVSDPTSYGNDLYMSTNDRPGDFDISMYQGEENNLEYMQFNVGYIINLKTNLKFELGVVNRQNNSNTESINTKYYFFGLVTDLYNRYYDF